MKDNFLRTSLVAGAIGMVLGAASMQAASSMSLDASALYRAFTRNPHHEENRPGLRDLQQDGRENANEGKRADVTRPTKTRP